MAPLPLRVIDTGVHEGRLNIAFDEALAELHKSGCVPDTLRFMRFPPTALVGRHQAISQELKLDHCRANGIGIVRRITGGGAIFLDEGQLGWELVLSRARLSLPALGDTTRLICEAAAAGLSKAFGIDARFRPRNDIEVGGRKLGGTGGLFDGDTLVFQGTVLIDADRERVMACLNVPAAKLAKHNLAAGADRLVTLKALLGTAPSIEDVQRAMIDGLAGALGAVPTRSDVTSEEERLAREYFDQEIGTDAFVYGVDAPTGGDVLEGSHSGPGGTVTAYVRLEGPDAARRVREVLITGDFFITPPRIVYDLEAVLRGVPAEEAAAEAGRFLEVARPDLLSITPADIALAVERAVASERPSEG